MSWLPTLIIATPEERYDLEIKLSRMAVKKTQPDDAARTKMRPEYANSANSLTQVSGGGRPTFRPWHRPITTGAKPAEIRAQNEETKKAAQRSGLFI